MTSPAPSNPVLSNRYQLLQTLGSGGTAVVYRARDLMLERQVAIKVLRPDFGKDESFRERFRQEARAAANISHPNIVTVHDFGLDHDRLFIVMEFIPGTDLKTVMRKHGPFELEEAIPLILQACAGLGHAHRSGIVHCDVKPHNMLVTPEGQLKVTDFGIARALAGIHPEERSDVVWGSPQYFSPEQASGIAPSPASDVYSLGVVLYEMLTGQLPLNADTATELARMHRDVPPVPPRQIKPELPRDLERILLKVLSKEPAARYRSADQFGQVLSTFGRTPELIPIVPAVESVEVRPVSRPRSRRESVSFPVNAIKDFFSNGAGIDWISIGLGLLTLISVGGLIPYWTYIFMVIRSLQR
ncbi:MAG: serine/threonine protein kinase [Leptolinea sp.]|jgi:serine/threonine-protein kinase|nr:serine/threonine protein kinase [Leptolinea sp.]